MQGITQSETDLLNAIKEITIQDVLPLSTGFKNSERLLNVCLPKNTPYGQSCFREYVTCRDYHRHMIIHIGQGERPLFNDNHKIGTLKITVPPCPVGRLLFVLSYQLIRMVY